MNQTEKLQEQVFNTGEAGFKFLVEREAVEGFIYGGLLSIVSLIGIILSIYLIKEAKTDGDAIEPAFCVTIITALIIFAAGYCFLNAIFPEATVIKTFIGAVK